MGGSDASGGSGAIYGGHRGRDTRSIARDAGARTKRDCVASVANCRPSTTRKSALQPTEIAGDQQLLLLGMVLILHSDLAGRHAELLGKISHSSIIVIR